MRFQTKAALLFFFLLMAFGIMSLHVAAMNKLDKNGNRTIASVEVEKTDEAEVEKPIVEEEKKVEIETEVIAEVEKEKKAEVETEAEKEKEEVACVDCENKGQDKYELALSQLTNLLLKILNLQQSFNEMLYAQAAAPATTIAPSPVYPSAPAPNWYDQYIMPDNSYNYWNSPYYGGMGYASPDKYNNYYSYNNSIGKSYAENFQTQRVESIDARELDYSLFESNQPAIGYNFANSPRYSINGQSAGFIDLR